MTAGLLVSGTLVGCVAGADGEAPSRGAEALAAPAPPACTGAGPSAIERGLARPHAVASDGARVFWSELGVGSTDLDGTIASALVTGGRATVLAAGQGSPSAIALDATSVSLGPISASAAQRDRSGACPKLGGVAAPLAIGLLAPNALAVDALANVYFVAGDAVMTVSKLGGASLPIAIGQAPWTWSLSTGPRSTTATPRRSAARRPSTPCRSSEACPACSRRSSPLRRWPRTRARFYWIDFYGGVVSQPKRGGAVKTLATGAGGFGGIAVDDANVYFTQGASIVSVAKGGGATTVLATASTLPQGLAVDASAIYWTTDSTMTGTTYAADGQLVRLCKKS